MSFGNAAKSGFTLEDLTKMGPDEITRKRKIAEALLAQSQGIHPIANPLEGMAQMAQALIGNLKGARLDRAEREGKEGANAMFSAGMGMGEFPAAPGGGGGGSSAATGGSSGGYAPVNPNVADGRKGDESYPVASAGGGDIEAYIRQAAQKRGYDPDAVMRIVMNEGGVKDPALRSRGHDPAVGGQEQSYGPFQLNMHAGLGKRLLEEKGIDARDPANVYAGIDYALDRAGEEGWTPWLNTKNKLGYDKWTGLKRGGAGTAVQSAQAAAPAQVASLDPSIGVPPAANAMLPPAAGAPGQEAIAKALLGPTGYDPAANPANSWADALMAKNAADPNAPNISTDTAGLQPLPTPAAPNVAPPGTPPAAQVPIPAPAAAAPQAAGVPAQQVQMAQALTGGQPDIGMTMGAPAIQPGGPDLRTLMGMAGNEFMSPQQQKLIEALTGQRMESEAKKADPAYQMGLEKSRIELDRLKNPQMTPYEQTQTEMARAKAAADAEKLKFDQSDTTTDNEREAAKFKLDQAQANLTTGTKEYEAYKRDEVNAGRTPLGRLEYEQELRKSGASSTNVDISGGTGKQVFDAVAASAEKATTAVAGLASLQEANKALDAGIISGSAADMRLGLQKLGALFGADPTSIENTETFRSAIAPQVAAVMKATVGNVQISDADREFAEKAAGGSIALDDRSIKRLMKIMEKGSRAIVDRHQKILDKVYPETPDGKFDRERALFGIDVPAAPPPAPPPAKRIEDMTDEELEELTR